MVTLIWIDGSLWLCEETGDIGNLREEDNGDISLEYYDVAKGGPNLRRWIRQHVTLRN